MNIDRSFIKLQNIKQTKVFETPKYVVVVIKFLKRNDENCI